VVVSLELRKLDDDLTAHAVDDYKKVGVHVGD
jgi:hypothetical protein